MFGVDEEPIEANAGQKFCCRAGIEGYYGTDKAIAGSKSLYEVVVHGDGRPCSIKEKAPRRLCRGAIMIVDCGKKVSLIAKAIETIESCSPLFIASYISIAS